MENGHRPLQESDLIFPSAASSIRDTLGALKRSNLSVTNRLRSISQDAKFVLEVSKVYDLPLVANERCGSWYIDPSQKAGSAYFKSTDGHFGQWGVSLRRLNLHILETIGGYGGCIIVDSTRRGKSMPDALSKTIPIWIAALNRLLFPDLVESHNLHTPPEVVSESEHSQIEDRLESAVKDLRSLLLDEQGLRAELKGKPMKPAWVTPGTLTSDTPNAEGHHLVVMCTASGSTSEPTHNIYGYVQGAADDHESWAHGLDAVTFWNHSEKLLSTSEDQLPLVIGELMAAGSAPSTRKPIIIRPTSSIWIADQQALEEANDVSDFDIVVSCSTAPSTAISSKLKSRYLHLICSDGKIGSRQLRTELSRLESVAPLLTQNCRILVACSTGRDLSVGAALTLICLYFQDNGSLREDRAASQTPNKTLIKHRLSWIMVSIPDAKPSRATLQSVNSFLMG